MLFDCRRRILTAEVPPRNENREPSWGLATGPHPFQPLGPDDREPWQILVTLQSWMIMVRSSVR
ncbi:hypothetical protein A5728_10255 [Kocuria sp. ICS0012]|nr:hypothetical protein A5728_10255 [Kocuria sp. ICS0012]